MDRRVAYSHVFEHSWDVSKFVTDGNRLTIPSDWNEDLQQLIKDCWDNDPLKRPSFKEIEERIEAVWREMHAKRLEEKNLNQTKQEDSSSEEEQIKTVSEVTLTSDEPKPVQPVTSVQPAEDEHKPLIQEVEADTTIDTGVLVNEPEDTNTIDLTQDAVINQLLDDVM